MDSSPQRAMVAGYHPVITADKLAAIQSPLPPGAPGQTDPTQGLTTAALIPKLESLLAESVETNYQGERVIQLLRLQRADNFYRGIQNIAPMMDESTGSLLWTQFGASGAPIANPDDMERAFDYNPRLTGGYGQKFTSVLGERPFYNTTAEPANPKSDIDRRGARQVNLLIQMFHQQWDAVILNHRLAYTIFKSGTPYGYCRPVTDGGKHGYDDIPILQMATVEHPDFPDMSMQVPVQIGIKRVPRTSVDLSIHDSYTVSVPFSVKLLPDSPELISECDLDWGIIVTAHPNARIILGDDGGSGGSAGIGGDAASATAAVVRAASQSQTGTIRTRNTMLRTYRMTWLAPSRLQLIKDKTIREATVAKFPEGMKIVQVEGQIIAITAQSLTACWSAIPPGMADYLLADGISWGMFGLEDAMSNLLNIAMETLETGIPSVLVNQNYVNTDAINRNRYSPNRAIAALPKAGETLDNAFKQFPTSTFPQEIPEVAAWLKDLMEQFYGLLPQVYGQMPPGQTLGQARMALTQGLMQLATIGALMTRWWEQSDTNAVRMYCDVAGSNPTFGGQTIDLDLIRNAQWTIRGSSTIPRSFEERKETLKDIITQNPDLAKAMGMTSPVNFPVLGDYLDLPELKNPDSDMVEALNDIADQLWSGQTQMIPGPDGTPTPQASIQFDGLVFDPKIAVAVMQSQLGNQTAQAKIASPGYANVHAYLQAAQDAAQKANAPQPEAPRATVTIPVDKLPSDQEVAVLQKLGFGVSATPPPGMPAPHTVARVTEINAKALAEQKNKEHEADLQHASSIAMPPPPVMGPPPLGSPGPPEMQGMVQ